jgi:aspartyl-tRNA(Asn)/glutamyl-tRNA(Gln) amidotransferase subunit C
VLYNKRNNQILNLKGRNVAQERLSHNEVRDIAELAKLQLSDEEVAKYAQQLNQILDYFTMLQEVDTSQVNPTDSVLPLKTVMRPDTLGQALSPQEVVANAPAAEANQFKVNAVLGDE